MYSKYKNEIVITFNSDDEKLAQLILDDILKMIDSKDLKLKALKSMHRIEPSDLKSKGAELLESLDINVNDIHTSEDLINSKNISATLFVK